MVACINLPNFLKKITMIKPIDIINSISVFQLTFFVIYIFRRGTNSLQNNILGAFFLTQIIVLANYASNNIFADCFHFRIHTTLIGLPIWFLWGPLMYFYIHAQIQKGFKFKSLHLLHLFPFLLALVYFSSTFYFLDTESKLVYINSNSMRNTLLVANTLVNLQVICYNMVSLFKLINYQKQIINFSSSFEKQNINWLKLVLYGYIFACLVSEFFFFTSHIMPLSNSVKEILIFAAFLLFFNVLFYKAILNPYIFIELEAKNSQNSIEISSTQLNNSIEQLENYISQKKPYLNSMLTLKDLSNETGISDKHLSYIINHHYKMNFFTFINSLRIDEAKKLLLAGKVQELTILGIAYESGFNSKSVFYDAFKKYVGKTPLEYLRQ